MGKVLGGILGTLVFVILIFFLLSHFGLLSWGNNEGNDNGETKKESFINEQSLVMDETEEITITIVVQQDQYLIDNQNVTLTQIKEKVTDEFAVVKVILEDNYASTKAWDDIKTNFARWGVTPVEQ